MNDIDGVVSVAEPHGSVPLPLSLERMVPKSRYCARRLEPFNTHQVHPQGELADYVNWDRDQLLSGRPRQLDFRQSSVPHLRVRAVLDITPGH